MGKQRDPSWAGEYFAEPGTVAAWWDPTSEDDPAFRQWMIAQTDDSIRVCRPAGRTVFDAATGRGRAAVAHALAGASRVVAADISEEMLELARENALHSGTSEKIELLRTDLEAIPVASDQFDIVLLLEVLLHFPRPLDVLRELNRILVPGGLIFLTTVGANPFARLLQPGKAGRHAASRWKLAAAAGVNMIMTEAFGFTWERTETTSRLYRRFYNAPVSPTYPHEVRALLSVAGFVSTYHRSLPNPYYPREHRWVAFKDEEAQSVSEL